FETQPEIISKINSALSEIKECSLKVRSTPEGMIKHLQEQQIDIIFLSHHKDAVDEITKIRDSFPETYVIALLPPFDEELVNEYIGRAHGLLFKNENCDNDLMNALKKALIKVLDRKAFLASSLSKTIFFRGTHDMEMLL